MYGNNSAKEVEGMIVILPCLQDPTDVVLQGEIIGDSCAMDWRFALGKAADEKFECPALIPLIQGDVIGDYKMKGFPVPRAIIGQSDWYGIRPRLVGPMRQAGGRIEMLDIGGTPPDPLAPYVEPTRKWLKSTDETDSTGALLADFQILGASEATNQLVLFETEELGDITVTIPRGAIYRSGLSKRTTAVTLPSDFQMHTVLEYFTESTQTFLISGITKDKNGAALGGCTVVAMQVDDSGTPVNTIIARTVSDGSGNFTISVHQSGSFQRYQLVAFQNSSPDVGGISDNSLQASDTSVNIYLYDVTTLAGGSVGLPVINSGLVRSA